MISDLVEARPGTLRRDWCAAGRNQHRRPGLQGEERPTAFEDIIAAYAEQMTEEMEVDESRTSETSTIGTHPWLAGMLEKLRRYAGFKLCSKEQP